MGADTKTQPRITRMLAKKMPDACRALDLQKRADGIVILTGYASVFYREGDPATEYQLWSDMIERVMPGAFDRAIRENQDVRCLYNHSVDRLLGRTKSNTLRLSVDSVGLHYEDELPSSDDGTRMQVLLDRGDLDGSSFSFVPRKTVWVEEGNVLIRELWDVDLFDVGPVVFPAYSGTTAGVRSADDRDALLAEAEAALKKQRAGKTSQLDVDYRLTEIQNEQYRRRFSDRG